MAQDFVMEGGLPPLQLTGVSFDKVVKNDDTQRVVFFCVDWLDECEEMKYEFRKMAMQRWQVAPLRYAEVNCAKEKVLCNKEGVQTYPSVNRYVNGRRVQVWQGDLGSPNLQVQQKELLTWIRSSYTEVEKADQEVEEQMAENFRLAVDLVVLAALLLAFIKLCMNMIRSAHNALAETDKARHAHLKQEALHLAFRPSCRLARRLPQSWAAERGIIEL